MTLRRIFSPGFFWSALATVQYERSPDASPSFSSSPLDGAVGRSCGGGWPQQRDGPPDSPQRWRTLSAAVLQLTGQIGVRVGVLLLLLLHPHISRMHAGMTTREGRTAAGHGIAGGGGGADVLDACAFFLRCPTNHGGYRTWYISWYLFLPCLRYVSCPAGYQKA